MSDNKEHIEKLEDLRHACVPGGNGREALDAAIRALKFEDAAKAKDEEAERSVCAEFLDNHVEPASDGDSWLTASRGYRIGELMELRAQARAEGYAAGRADQAKVPCVQHGDQLTLREQLAAAQAEIERLKAGK